MGCNQVFQRARVEVRPRGSRIIAIAANRQLKLTGGAISVLHDITVLEADPAA